MIIFEIRDAYLKTREGADQTIGYLFYYEKSKRFFMELLSDLKEWEAPTLFYADVKKGNYSIDSARTMQWVRQRIIPSERQNLGAVLRENNLKEYDEYKLLLCSEGRCAQDEEYILKMDVAKLPEVMQKRLSQNIKDVMFLFGNRFMVFFLDGTTRLISADSLLKGRREFSHILENQELFSHGKVSPGGHGIEWDEERFISARELYASGKKTELGYDDLLLFARTRLVDTTEVTESLGVSRQYVSQLVKQERLKPILTGSTIQFFAKASIEREDENK